MDMLNTIISRQTSLLAGFFWLLTLGCSRVMCDANRTSIPESYKSELRSIFEDIKTTLARYDEEKVNDAAWSNANNFAFLIDSSAKEYLVRYDDIAEIIGRRADFRSSLDGTIEYMLKDASEFPLILMLDVDYNDRDLIVGATVPFVQY